MKRKTYLTIVTFFVCFLIISTPLILFPVNLFDGEIIYKNGIIEPRPLSLSYFFGLGYDLKDMGSVASFHLVSKGYFLAFILTVGIPALIAYRVYLVIEK
jgi:hypothetical protein